MRFAHLADCHIGSWRDPKLREASTKAFVKAIDLAVSRKVDFMIIAGDLFNTSLPSVELLRETVDRLKKLRDMEIPVYLIAGSHDYSPSGKTMLDVLEKAGLFINVVKNSEIADNKIRLRFTIDRKTGAKITGMLGKKGSLEKGYYSSLIKEDLESEQGYKIFLFHSALTELKPESLKDIESHPISLLPKNFNYYAGGHPHYVYQKHEKDYGLIAYPGPLFPNNFKELEDLETGGIYIVDVDEDNRTRAEFEPVQIYNIHKINIHADNKTPEQVEEEIREDIKNREFPNTIITLRAEGTLSSGKPSDINWKELFQSMYDKSAYFIMKNTSKMVSREFEEIKAETVSADDVESNLIKEHIQQIKVDGMSPEKEEKLVNELMHSLHTEKQEGETVSTFETRLKQDIDKILDLD